jgi:hypothetical protein
MSTNARPVEGAPTTLRPDLPPGRARSFLEALCDDETRKRIATELAGHCKTSAALTKAPKRATLRPGNARGTNGCHPVRPSDKHPGPSGSDRGGHTHTLGGGLRSMVIFPDLALEVNPEGPLPLRAELVSTGVGI